jgi:hypothetical protein
MVWLILAAISRSVAVFLPLHVQKKSVSFHRSNGHTNGRSRPSIKSNSSDESFNFANSIEENVRILSRDSESSRIVSVDASVTSVDEEAGPKSGVQNIIGQKRKIDDISEKQFIPKFDTC